MPDTLEDAEERRDKKLHVVSDFPKCVSTGDFRRQTGTCNALRRALSHRRWSFLYDESIYGVATCRLGGRVGFSEEEMGLQHRKSDGQILIDLPHHTAS
jgi:hypothetical protein